MEKLIKILKGIWTFLNSKVFTYIVIFIVLLFIGKSCSDLREERRQNTIHEQNIAALTDSITWEKTKSGKLQAEKTMYLSTIKELKLLDSSLYSQVKDQKGQIISLTSAVFQLKQDKETLQNHINYLESIMGKPIQLNDTTYLVPWHLKYDWDSLNYDILDGQTQIGINIKPGFVWRDGITNNDILRNAFSVSHYKTELTQKESQIQLTWGEKVVDGKLKVYFTTQYPGFTPKSLEGWMIDPNSNEYIKKLMKKKQWLPGTWSVGGGPSFGYNLLTGKSYAGFGFNLNYTIYQF